MGKRKQTQWAPPPRPKCPDTRKAINLVAYFNYALLDPKLGDIAWAANFLSKVSETADMLWEMQKVVRDYEEKMPYLALLQEEHDDLMKRRAARRKAKRNSDAFEPVTPSPSDAPK